MVTQTPAKPTIGNEVDRANLLAAIDAVYLATEKLEMIRQAADPMNEAETLRAARLKLPTEMLYAITNELRTLRAAYPAWPTKKVE